MAHPKRLSKRLQKEAEIPLNRAQLACAVMFGYKDWHELDQVTAAKQNAPSKPDWLVSSEVSLTRCQTFHHRLYRVLNGIADESGEPAFAHDEVWDLLENLSPTGAIPDDASFFDPRLGSIFPTLWRLTAEASSSYFDTPPPKGFGVSVGHLGSRNFETLVATTIKTHAVPNETANSYTLRDEVGFRTFAFEFPDRERFRDLKNDVRAAVIVPFRFVPTIVDDVMLELELALHPAAIASSHVNEADAELIAESICAYLRDSAIWSRSDACISGATNGIHITLTGNITSPAVARILDALVAELGIHEECFDPDDPFCDEMIFLPVRELTVDLENEVTEEAESSDFLANHGDEFVQFLFRETVAMSRAPAILERLLISNGFSQYAEFCHGLNVVSSLDEQRKFVKFVCSMDKARAIAPHHSLFFRYDVLTRLLGKMERESNDPSIYEDQSSALSEKDIARYASAARMLGDDEMALMIEQDHDSLWSATRTAHHELIDLIMEFAPEEAPDEQESDQAGSHA